MELQTTTALEIFEAGLTKTDIKTMANAAVESVKEQGNPLQVAEALKAMEEFISEVRGSQDFIDYVREETIKYGKTYTSKSGCKIEVCEVGSSYDFRNCNDPELSVLEIALMTAKERVDKRKEFLKTIPLEGMDILVDGSVERVYPPSKSSKSSFKVSLKNK
jgi:hypothetical protein